VGDVLQFKRKPAVSVSRGFAINIDPSKAEAFAQAWGAQQREKWRISPDRDGTIVLEFSTPIGVVRFDLSVEDADLLKSDLGRVSFAAERLRLRLRGEDTWRAEPIDGRDAFTVRFQDHVATFVAVVLRRAWRCALCGGSFPAGTRMYRQDGRSKHRVRGGPTVFSSGAMLGDMDRRACKTCMSPVGPDVSPTIETPAPSSDSIGR
jgi:hypothetical protein